MSKDIDIPINDLINIYDGMKNAFMFTSDAAQNYSDIIEKIEKHYKGKNTEIISYNNVQIFEKLSQLQTFYSLIYSYLLNVMFQYQEVDETIANKIQEEFES